MGWIRKAVGVGRITEPKPPAPQQAMKPPAGVRGSLQIRHVDAGSCNGCEVEIAGAFGAVYDAERFGARLVASPRHADALLVTGVVTHNMADPLRITLDATPRPRAVSGRFSVVWHSSDETKPALFESACSPRK